METYRLVFNGEELNVIFNALAEKPYREVAGLFNTINMQIQAAREESARKEVESKDLEVVEAPDSNVGPLEK